MEFIYNKNTSEVVAWKGCTNKYSEKCPKIHKKTPAVQPFWKQEATGLQLDKKGPITLQTRILQLD